MMQTDRLANVGELELLDYRRQRIEMLLSDGIVSTEMENQLRLTLNTLERQVEFLKAYQVPSAQRHAA